MMFYRPFKLSLCQMIIQAAFIHVYSHSPKSLCPVYSPEEREFILEGDHRPVINTYVLCSICSSPAGRVID